MSLKIAVLLGGLANDRIALPSVLVRLRSAPQALLLKRWWTYAISVLALQSLVFSIADIDKPTLLYNDNDACVKWSHNMTSKAVRHIELCENSVCEWAQDKTNAVMHVAGKINPTGIFTKEIRDGTHFRWLHDSFMSWLSDFLNTSLLESHHARQRSPHSVVPSAAWVTLASSASSYLSALAANTFCWSATSVSHLCSASRQLL